MKKIYVSSDVTCSFQIVNNDNYIELKKLCIDKLINYPIISISGIELSELIIELENLIEKKINNREIPNEFQQNLDKEVRYKNLTIKLYLRNEIDFHIYTLINLYSIIQRTLLSKGCVYIYDRSFFQVSFDLDIIRVLRLNNSMTQQKIIEFIKKSHNTNDEAVINTIHLLISYGIIDQTEFQNEYMLTARGYLLR